MALVMVTLTVDSAVRRALYRYRKRLGRGEGEKRSGPRAVGVARACTGEQRFRSRSGHGWPLRLCEEDEAMVGDGERSGPWLWPRPRPGGGWVVVWLLFVNVNVWRRVLVRMLGRSGIWIVDGWGHCGVGSSCGGDGPVAALARTTT